MTTEVTLILSSGRSFHWQTADYFQPSVAYICRNCGEVYARRICKTNGNLNRFCGMYGTEVCRKCPSHHPYCIPGSVSSFGWEHDWPDDLLAYHLELYLSHYDKGQAPCL